jgi:chitin disaccharide deacetylase
VNGHPTGNRSNESDRGSLYNPDPVIEGARGIIRLITRGDDMGAFQAGNQAIVDACKHGILRNASLMMPGPQIAHAVRLLKEVPELCLGLHVTLTSEWDSPRWGPISAREDVPSLVDADGFFFPHPDDLFRQGGVLEEALREVRAQLACARSFGLDIRYLDEHMGVGWLFDPADRRRTRLSQALRNLAHEEGLVWHEDIADLRRVESGTRELSQVFRRLEQGTYLLITHPAYFEPEMQAVVGQSSQKPGTVALARLHDYQQLCDPLVMRAVHERGIGLSRYDDVLSSGR